MAGTSVFLPAPVLSRGCKPIFLGRSDNMVDTADSLSDFDPFSYLKAQKYFEPDTVCPRLSDVLEQVEPKIGAAVLDARGRAALRRVTGRIPAHLSPFWGLELRLGDTPARADVLWEVAQGSGGVLTLAGRNPYDPASDVTEALRQRSPFWMDLGRFAEEWLDGSGWLRDLCNIWLETDTSTMEDAELDACLDRPSLFWGASAASDGNLVSHLAALGRRFYGLELDQARIDSLTAAIPGKGRVFQMGVMGARESPAARLCVRNLDSEMLEHWTAAIGWPGDPSSLRKILAGLESLSYRLALDVDILPDRVGPKLGIEIYCAKRVVSMEVWRPVCDVLVAQGLVQAEKLAALDSFPSLRQFRQIGARNRKPPIGYPVLGTNLHHLKVVFAGDAAIEAKAYLGIYRPMMDYSRTKGHCRDGGGGWL